MRVPKRILGRRLPQRDEVGAVAVVVGAISLVLVLIAAFAVDIGMQRVARRDMQSLSDVVSLDLVRELDGRTVAQLDPLMPALAQAAGGRNDSTVGDPPTFEVVLGELDATGIFQPLTGTKVPSAVKVTSSTSVDFSFTSGRGGANRSAIAAMDAGACFKIGSLALGIDTTKSGVLNGLIGGALGSSLNISALSYQGLASAGVNLADVLAVNNLGVGTVDELLTTDVSLVNFYNATATVLDNQGNVAQANIFGALALQVQGSSKVKLGDIITAEQGTTAAAAATFNALDLLYGAALVSDGKSFVSVPSLGISVPGVTNLTGSVSIIQPAKQACGRNGSIAAQTTTQQIETNLSGTIANLPGVSAVGLNISEVAINIAELRIAVAQATGRLVDSECGEPSVATPDSISVFATPGLVNINGRLGVQVKAKVSLPLGPLAALVLVDVVINIPVTLATASSAPGQQVDMIFSSLADYQNSHAAGSAGIGIAPSALTLDQANTTVTAALLGIPISLGSSLATVLNLTSGLTSSLTTSLNSTLINPLLNALGVRLASADVFGIPRPECDVPSLKG